MILTVFFTFFFLSTLNKEIIIMVFTLKVWPHVFPRKRAPKL